MNLFATVLTYPAPSANYRGESELNRTVIQKVTDGRFDYPIFSPESMRNALRETLAKYGLPCNRQRLHDEEQLAVKFADLPDPGKYADDFFFGYLVAAGSADRKKYLKEIEESRGKKAAEDFTFKRDSVLRMNLAKALEPYRHNAVFTQSPLAAEGSAYKNAATSALLHRETVVSAFQYPFALNLLDCKSKSDWTRNLLQAIGELNGVAGNHARSYFEMAPASIVVRLTKQLVAGYQTYGFNSKGEFPEVIDGILRDPPDYPGNEFFIGGKVIKDMETVDEQMKKEQAKKQRPENQAEEDGAAVKGHIERLTERGVTVDRDPRRLLATVADRFLGGA